MSQRTRTSWSVAMAAGLLLLTLAGSAAAAPLESEDLDGNGVADTCQSTAVVADPAAVDAAVLLVDLDGDGLISVREAAHSDWIGGKNCNHGGYVSSIAADADDECDEGETPGIETDESETPGVETDESEVETISTACSDEEITQAADDPLPVECTAEATPEETDPAETVEPNAHGKSVSEVAHSDAVGGKNCNHGGAVSEAAKQGHGNKVDHETAKATKQLAKLAKNHGKGHHGPN